eukprot:752844-Hanusia_phi.AAC.1
MVCAVPVLPIKAHAVIQPVDLRAQKLRPPFSSLGPGNQQLVLQLQLEDGRVVGTTIEALWAE